MLRDFICVKFKTSKTNIQWQKPKCWWLWGRGCLLPGTEQKGSFAMKKCSIPCCGEGYKGVSYINIHWIVHLRFVYFAVYTLYLNLKKKRYGPKVRSWSYSFYGGFFPPWTNKQTKINEALDPSQGQQIGAWDLSLPSLPHHQANQGPRSPGQSAILVEALGGTDSFP